MELVYIDGASKYSFTDINWIGKWLVDNINKYSGVKEIGSKDSITLSELARKINSTSTFEGLIDNQLIEDLEEYDSKSNYVYKFLNDFKKITFHIYNWVNLYFLPFLLNEHYTELVNNLLKYCLE